MLRLALPRLPVSPDDYHVICMDVENTDSGPNGLRARLLKQQTRQLIEEELVADRRDAASRGFHQEEASNEPVAWQR